MTPLAQKIARAMQACTVEHHKARTHIKQDADHWQTTLIGGSLMSGPSIDKLAQAAADAVEPPLDKA